MVKANGKVYTTIEITISEAINVLFEECVIKDKDFFVSNEKQLDEKSLLIKKALYTVSTYIKRFVGENATLNVRCVFDTKAGEFNISGSDVLDKVIELFYLRSRGRRDMCKSASTDTPGKKGVYSYYDAAQHGSPMWEYKMLYKGIKAEETFEAIKYLEYNYTEFINLNTYDQTLILER